eukprot:gnl/TRDRNA2_/TRDRNA2_91514_c0_seq4.p1 gnl/TRDRNA2_/TRDRNA2_91514_c0~~gnl/TRDRNA2_/TRDRNA2_91514_c0_seq4.p1  ORF type:complete len:354 (+),score=66.18 gnl/TRDRNA2_/TRDRNA2_91514_c0_seq4:130-1062(+)
MVRNGEASAPWMAKDRLLKEHRGAYTTARTVDQTLMFELSMHCTRLHETATDVFLRELGDSERGKEVRTYLEAGPEALKPLVRQEVSAALDFLRGGGDAEPSGNKTCSTAPTDFQVTMLMTWDSVGEHTPGGRGFDFFTYAQPLPQIEPMVAVEAHKATRNNPTVKDVQWIKDREALEQVQKAAGVNEIVMFDDDGAATEGLQTNFFAVAADGTVFTAPAERVLSGTVRKVVLEVAEQNGIPLRMEAPNMRDVETWESCFVCSTSRLVKPIRELVAPELGIRRTFPTEGSITHRIEQLVLENMRSHSEPI